MTDTTSFTFNKGFYRNILPSKEDNSPLLWEIMALSLDLKNWIPLQQNMKRQTFFILTDFRCDSYLPTQLKVWVSKTKWHVSISSQISNSKVFLHQNQKPNPNQNTRSLNIEIRRKKDLSQFNYRTRSDRGNVSLPIFAKSILIGPLCNSFSCAILWCCCCWRNSKSCHSERTRTATSPAEASRRLISSASKK